MAGKVPCKCPACGSGVITQKRYESDVAEVWMCECGNPTCPSDYRAGGQTREAAMERFRNRAGLALQK